MWRLISRYVVRKSKIAEWLYTEMKLDCRVGAARLRCFIALDFCPNRPGYRGLPAIVLLDSCLHFGEYFHSHPLLSHQASATTK